MSIGHSTLSRLSELIKADDDLSRIEALKEDLIKEKISIDSQLNIEAQNKYDDAINIADSLQDSGALLKELKDNLGKINNLKNDSINSIDKYSLFDKASTYYSNFNKAEEVLNKFKSVESEIQFLNNLILESLPQDEFYEGTASIENLLLIHYKLTQIWDFKDELEYLASQSTDDSRHIVRSALSQFDGTIKSFDRLMKPVSETIFEALKCGNLSLVCRWAKIMEYEEVEDFKCKLYNKLSSEAGINGNDHSNTRSISSFRKSMLNNDNSNGSNTNKNDNLRILKQYVKRKNPRNFKDKFLKFFEDSIKETFENCKEEQNVQVVLNSLDDWYYPELTLFKTYESRCFPSRWKLFDTLILPFYQTNLRDLFQNIMIKEPENALLLSLLELDYENNNKLRKQLGIPKSKIIQLINNEERTKLLDDYLSLTINKTDEWVSKVVNPAFELFAKRSQEPPDTSFERLGIETSQTIITILNGDINALADAMDTPILVKFIKYYCSELLFSNLNRWRQILNDECSKWPIFLNAQPEESEDTNSDPENVGFLPRYVTVLANDALKGANGLPEALQKCKEMVHENFHSELEQYFEVALQGYLNLGRQCLVNLTEMVMFEIAPDIDYLFSKSWYSGDGDGFIDNSLKIIESYLINLNDYLEFELYESFFETILDTFLIKYLEKLEKIEKINDDKICNYLQRDYNLLYQFFTGYEIQQTDVEFDLSIFEIIFEFFNLNTNNELIESFKNGIHKFNDLPVSLATNILRKRKICDDKTVKFLTGEFEHVLEELKEENSNNLMSTFLSNLNKK